MTHSILAPLLGLLLGILTVLLIGCEYSPGELQARDAIAERCAKDCSPYKSKIIKYIGINEWKCFCKDEK